MIEAAEQTHERMAFDMAFNAALQHVVDMALDFRDQWREHSDFAVAPLGVGQKLSDAVDAYRALGGCHSDDLADLMGVVP